MDIQTDLPAWDNSSEYPNLADVAFENDVRAIEALIARIESLNADLAANLAGIHEAGRTAQELRGNLTTYVNCELAVDAANPVAEKALSRLMQLGAKMDQALLPHRAYAMKMPDDAFEKFLADPRVADAEFDWRQRRLEAGTLLDDKEEILIAALRPAGHESFEQLYNRLMGTMSCPYRHEDGRVEPMGLAKAQALTKMPPENIRKAAWTAVQEAWRANREAGAAVLNGLAGWRLELADKRAKKAPFDFLTPPLREGRLERRTLDAMMTAIADQRERTRAGLRAMAAAHGKKRLDPWDLLAPAPGRSAPPTKYEDALALIKEALGAIDPSIADFVGMMRDRNWLEARVLPTKKGGAFSTGFAKSRTVRVFQTYMGSFADVTTLAHELGHAYHSWVIRDLPLEQRNYPMTLAETASVLFETLLGNHLAATAKDEATRFEAGYADAEHAAAFLVNIPARFEFEKSFYERRKQGFVPPDELSRLTDEAWTKWYGDTLSENDRLYWATKMHFSFADVSFYNFPYSFGYLFANAIDARRAEFGRDFPRRYVELLRDTGRMTVEDLIRRHFGEDAGSAAFWEKSLSGPAAKIEGFRKLSAPSP